MMPIKTFRLKCLIILLICIAVCALAPAAIAASVTITPTTIHKGDPVTVTITNLHDGQTFKAHINTRTLQAQEGKPVVFGIQNLYVPFDLINSQKLVVWLWDVKNGENGKTTITDEINGISVKKSSIVKKGEVRNVFKNAMKKGVYSMRVASTAAKNQVGARVILLGDKYGDNDAIMTFTPITNRKGIMNVIVKVDNNIIKKERVRIVK